MKDFERTLSVILSLLFLATFLTSTIIRFVKRVKEKKERGEDPFLFESLLLLIEQAEKTLASGSEKKAYVMEQSRKLFEKEGLSFSERKTEERLEELLSFTRMMNNRKKEETSE